MKKGILVSLIAVLLIAGLFVLTGCVKTEETNTETGASKSQEVEIKGEEKDSKEEIVNKSKLGEFVHYNVSLDIGDTNTVDDDWVVFYEDEETGITYLIAADYAPTTNTTYKAILDKLKFKARSTYITDCSESHIPYKEINPEIAKRFLLTWNGKRDSNKRSFTARVLDSEVWNDLALKKEDGTKYDESIQVIGTPTIELWIAAWIQKGYTPIYVSTDEANEAVEGTLAAQHGSGYFIGKTENPTQNDNIIFSILDKTGYSNTDEKESDKVFFPRTKELEDNCDGYWLAAPVANSTTPSGAYIITLGGRYNVGTVYYSSEALRPVVSLSTKLIGNDSSSEIYYTGKNIND